MSLNLTQINSQSFPSTLRTKVNRLQSPEQLIKPVETPIIIETQNNQSLSILLIEFLASVDKYVETRRQKEFLSFKDKKTQIVRIINGLNSNEFQFKENRVAKTETGSFIRDTNTTMNKSDTFDNGFKREIHTSLQKFDRGEKKTDALNKTDNAVKNPYSPPTKGQLQQKTLQIYDMNKKIIEFEQKDNSQTNDIVILKQRIDVLEKSLKSIQLNIRTVVQVYYPQNISTDLEELIQMLQDHLKLQQHSISYGNSLQQDVQEQVKLLNQGNQSLSQQIDFLLKNNKNLAEQVTNISQLSDQKKDSYNKSLKRYCDQLQQREDKIFLLLAQIEKEADINHSCRSDYQNILQIVDRLSHENQGTVLEMIGLKQRIQSLEQ